MAGAGICGPGEDLEENCVLVLHHSDTGRSTRTTSSTSLLPAVQTRTVRPATANRHCSSISLFSSLGPRLLWSGQVWSLVSREGWARLGYNFVKCSDHTTYRAWSWSHTRLATQTKCSRLIFTNDPTTAKRENLEAALLYITSIFLDVHINSEITWRSEISPDSCL